MNKLLARLAQPEGQSNCVCRVKPPSATKLQEHDCKEKVRPGTGREAGLGHAGGRAMQGAIAEGSETQF